MDVISHGLWGSLAFGRKNKRLFIIAFLIGVFPDVFAFGWFFIGRLVSGNYTHGPFPEIPTSIHALYNISHSLVIALAVLVIATLIWRKQALPLAAWPLHVLFDIPTHDVQFFPTPWAWPFSDHFVNGIPWSTPWVFFSNWGVLVGLYTVWLVSSRGVKRRAISSK